MERFRANLIVGGDAPPFVEDTWTEVSIGAFHFKVHSLHTHTCVHVCVRARVWCGVFVRVCYPPVACDQTSHHVPSVLQAVGACTRCNIICINQNSGERCDEDLMQILLAAKGKKQVRVSYVLENTGDVWVHVCM